MGDSCAGGVTGGGGCKSAGAGGGSIPGTGGGGDQKSLGAGGSVGAGAGSRAISCAGGCVGAARYSGVAGGAPGSSCVPLVSPLQNGTTSSGVGSRPQAVNRNFSASVHRYTGSGLPQGRGSPGSASAVPVGSRVSGPTAATPGLAALSDRSSCQRFGVCRNCAEMLRRVSSVRVK